MPARYCFVFLLLMTYSFLGWCGEMVYCSIGQRKLCEKRGFLNGPICPIYGHGALVVLFCLDGGCENPVLTFFLGAVLTSIVEYITSYAMEKLFHMRWWDYSRYKFHINGRVCLLNSTLFGLASVFLCHFANPPIAAWLTELFTAGVAIPLALVLTAVYLADIVLSVRSAIQIGNRLAKLHAIHDELAEKLEGLKLEQQQNIEAHKRKLESAKTAARQAAEKKLHALYERQDFFERRMLSSFPTMRSVRHPEALKKLREYRKSWKNNR
ncbi:MAG: putative ABC transporter permease [Oscillospiraceae bacterium]|nr:putative ABC transporter permease [Oscillospiraceae bacterium]